MTEQLSFNLVEDAELAKLAGQAGMAQALDAQGAASWKAAAALWLMHAQRGITFTADDLVAEVGLPSEGVNRNNVVGAWLSGQAKKGRIIWTGSFSKSRRVVRHGNHQRVWQVV